MTARDRQFIPPPGPGRPHILTKPFLWPADLPGGQDRQMTIGDAIPRWMVTAGCTWDEAAQEVGVDVRTCQGWLVDGGRLARALGTGRFAEADMTATDRLLYDFFGAVSRAGAEVVVRWQSILEREARGGFEIARVTEKWERNERGELVLTERTRVTETARPNVNVVMWKMSKQLARYRNRPPVIVMPGTDAAHDVVPLPPVSDEDRARDIAADLRKLKAIPVAASEN